MQPRRRAVAGFTLIELMVVVLIIGILAAFGLPQYLRSIENSKADDAVALVQMAGTTHRMYALDHSTTWLSGTIGDSCQTAACGGGTACDLVACKYMANQDFDSRSYVLELAADTSNSSCGGQSFTDSNCSSGCKIVACVHRRTSSDSPSVGAAVVSPYTSWGYAIDDAGNVMTAGGAPPPSGS